MSVKIDGKATDFAPYVISAETNTEYRRLATAEVVINDGGLSEEEFRAGDADAFLIGKEMSIFVGDKEADKCIFKGIIETQSIMLDDGKSELKITAKHAAYKMTLERKLRSFEDMTDKDVIESICGEYNIAVKMDSVSVKHERLVQYNSTDWDFINMRAEAMGLLLQTNTDGIVISRPDGKGKSVVEIRNGLNLQKLDVEMDARRMFSKYKAEAWNYTSQEADKAEASGGDNDCAIGNLSATDLAGKNGSSDMTTHLLTSQENSDRLTAWNDMLAMRTDMSRIIGDAQIWGFAPIAPGDVVTLKNVGKRFEGDSIISSVTQRIDGTQWLTTLHLGIDDTLYSELYDNIDSKPADGEMPAVSGLQIGKVKALEGDPLGEDRIYISLMGNEETKLWARLATLDAGNGRGTVFCPEIDDEVVVGFVNDHPNHAVVLGMLHSSSAPSPIEKKDDNHQKAIVTREKLQVLFDDEKKIITISTPGGNTLSLNDDDGGIFLEDQNGNKITMDSNGISIETNKALQLKASQDATVEGNNVNAKANAQLKLQGTAGSELSASGNTVVKGAMVQIN